MVKISKYKKNSIFTVAILIFSLIISPVISFAANPPSSETAGGTLQQQKQIEKEKKLEKEVTTERKKPEEVLPEAVIPEEAGEKVLIKKIVVEGATLIPEEAIKKIASQFEGKELSLKDMQKVADLITDEYRRKGFVTSRAYLAPQTIRQATLVIRIIEGKLGKVEIKGNRYFKTSLIAKKINLESNGYFDYSAFQRSLVYINEHPDRKARAVLLPGKEPGTTDIIVEVKDRLPIHIGFDYDNFGSRYINKNRGALTLEHNNLTGHDDKLYLKLQESSAGRLKMGQGRYAYSVNPTLDLGIYGAISDLKLGKEFTVLDSKGKATIAGIFSSKALVNKENLDIRFNAGFDYKHIRNYLLGVESSRDDLSVLKGGFDFDFNDKWARNLLSLELDGGIPRLFGALKAKDSSASRTQAGGEFVKTVVNYFRLQPGPFSSNFLWKNSGQFTNYNLVAAEQFQIGGPSSVRGYPPAEFSGDKGLYTSLEWSIPPYFIPRHVKVPLTNRTFYDSIRIVTFYDWAATYINRVSAGEKSTEILKGYGYGIRLNLGENFSARVEVGYPLDTRPSDNRHIHPWVEVATKF